MAAGELRMSCLRMIVMYARLRRGHRAAAAAVDAVIGCDEDGCVTFWASQL